MSKLRKSGATAAVAVAATTASMMVALPASAHPAPAPHVAGAHAKAPGKAELRSVRQRQRQQAAAVKPAPHFAASSATVFTVNTTNDTSLADPAGTTCADTDGNCSLRAAVEAANNLAQPVQIALDATNYPLSSGAALEVTNPAGTSIVGKGAGATQIQGAGTASVIREAPVDATSPSPLLFVSGTTLTGGSATDGGGLDIGYTYSGGTYIGATAVLDRIKVAGNTASSEGGGICAEYLGTVYLTNSTVANNVAPEGGGIYSDYTTLQLNQTKITHNSTTAGSTGYGGGIYLYGGVNDITAGSITNNTAGDTSDFGEGGGIYDYEGDTTLSGVAVNGNTAADGGYGGGIYVYYDLLDVTGGTISHNTASGVDGSGGGLYVDSSAQVGLHGVTMDADTTEGAASDARGGGAIFDYGYYNGNQLTIDSGTTITGANNSAVYLWAYEGGIDASIDASTLAGNTNTSDNLSSAGCGGAICGYAYDGSLRLDITRSSLHDNTAASDYAAGALSVYADEYGSTAANITSTTFQSNSAGPGGYGGAAGFYNNGYYSPVSVRMAHNSFIGNTAGTADVNGEGYGGALAVYDYAALTDIGSTFRGNRAVGDSSEGGALFNESYQSERLIGTKFLGNSAGTSSYGGAIYSSNYYGDDFRGVTISGNRATYGGGFYGDSDAYQASFDRSTISGNTAGSATEPGQGGGIYVADATLALKNTTVTGNTAKSTADTPGQGGGIWAEYGIPEMHYSTVSGNTAQLGGGYYTAMPTGAMLASIVSGNHTPGGAEQDCAGATTPALNSLGSNVLGQRACVTGLQTGDVVSKNPGLRPLANNGGPTQTLGLTAKSPAIDRGGYDCPATDQRGAPRAAASCDAGAYEFAPGAVNRVQPARGKAGTKITVSGSGFTFTRTVLIGGKKARHKIVSDRQLIAWAPRHRAGQVAVVVYTADGAGKQGQFTYTS